MTAILGYSGRLCGHGAWVALSNYSWDNGYDHFVEQRYG